MRFQANQSKKGWLAGTVGIEPNSENKPILRERKQNSPEALSNFRAVMFSEF